MDATQTIEIEEISDSQFVATVPSLGATVTGATRDEALNKALREIIARRITEAEQRKRQRGKDHTVA